MLLIPCPWCGECPESEFRCAGEARSVRPSPDSLSDEEWVNYLCYRSNQPTVLLEDWCHEKGCGEWFQIQRDTVTHKLSIAE